MLRLARQRDLQKGLSITQPGPLSADCQRPTGSPPTRLLIIGDTPFDGLAAKAGGIPFLAVCTGKYDRSAFTDSDAVAVIDTLAEGYDTILAVMQGEAAV